MPTRCTAQTKAGKPCQAFAVHNSNPPRCAAHGGSSAPVGAPPGNTNALKHGYYARPAGPTIEDAIHGLTEAMTRIWQLIEQHEGPNGHLAHLFQIYTQACSRLSRLLRDQQSFSGGAQAEFEQAINAALDHLSEKWQTPL